MKIMFSTFSIRILLLLTLSLGILSCNKRDDLEYWEKIIVPEAPYNIGELWAVNTGNYIYFGNESNSGGPQFFASYDMSTNSIAVLRTNGEICACGYQSKLITDYKNLYYFANSGVMYSPYTNSWSYVNYPNEFRNGESGCGYLNGKIYYIGGRELTRKVRYYNISTNTWSYLSNDFFYQTEASAVLEYNNKLFVIGGDYEGGKKVSFYDPITGEWSKKVDCPYETFENAIVFNNLIYIIGWDNIYSFDPGSDKWQKYKLPNEIDERATFPVVYNSNLYIFGYTYGTPKIIFYKFKGL